MPSPWAAHEAEAGGWIRRMFLEGQRLKAEFGADAVADLSLGQPLEAGDAVREAFAKAAADTFPGRFGYMPNSGYPAVRERCAADVQSDGVTAACITVTSGAAGAIALALRTFVSAGDTIVATAPFFPEFRLYAATLGSPFAVVATKDGAIDAAAIAEVLDDNTGALILNSPCNPSGHVISDAEYSAVATVLESHRRRTGRAVLLIVDEVYRRLHYPPAAAADPLKHWDNTVLARSFSKDLGVAGERIGYLVIHPSVAADTTERAIEMCARALGFVNAPATAQRALLHLDTWDVDIEPYRSRRDAALTAARAAGLEALEPGGGLYLWVRSPWEDTIAFIDRLASQKVLVTPGIAFGVPDHFRICFSATPDAIAMAGRELTAASAEAAPA